MMAVLWTAFIISALVKSPSNIPRFEWLAYPGVDKLIHVILFLIEAFLLSWSLSKPINVWKAAMIFTFCVALGGVLELIQHLFVDGRSGDTLDLLADALGVAIGQRIFFRFIKK